MERVVLALNALNAVNAVNAVNEAHNESAYETDEREQLCDFIDQLLTEHGIDVVALAADKRPTPGVSSFGR